MFKKTLLLLCLTTGVFAQPVGGSQGSQASVNLSSQGFSEITSGSGHLLQGGSQLAVVALKPVGDFVYVTLKALEGSTTVTIRISTNVVGYSLLGTGQIIQIIGTGAGNILSASGQLIAFIPNKMGKSLVYSSKI